jgi:hypothetical protein
MKSGVTKNKFYQKRLKLKAILLSLIVSLVGISLILNHLFTLTDDDTVFTVNGEPVSIAEFLHVRSGLRAATYSYFSQKYGARDSINFWITSLNGEVPAEILKQNTIDELKRIKSEQILMKINGITDDISYSGFLKDLDTENSRRKMEVMKKEPIYGPMQYDEKRFYEYLQSERIGKLKQILSGNVLLISEEEIRLNYNENKCGKYNQSDYIKIEKISLPVTNGYEDDSTIEKVKPEMVMSQILRYIRGGEKLKIVVTDFKSKGVKDVEFEEQVFDGSTLKHYAVLYPEISSKITDMNTNQISDIIRERNSLNIIKIIEKKAGVIKTYEEVRGQIMKELISKKYERMINKLLDTVNVKLKEKGLRKIPDLT